MTRRQAKWLLIGVWAIAFDVAAIRWLLWKRLGVNLKDFWPDHPARIDLRWDDPPSGPQPRPVRYPRRPR